MSSVKMVRRGNIATKRANNTQTFNFTGAFETFVVPGGVTTVTADLYGAAGRSANADTSTSKGGRVKCDIAVTPGETLRVYVGGGGSLPAGEGGGFNGGGGSVGFNGGGGGGATDVRRTPYALADRLAVAGGAGGMGANGGGQGGHGGIVGDAGSNGAAGGGGTPIGGGGGTGSAGGAAGAGQGSTAATAGVLGVGGDGGSAAPRGGGGGGGGYYGGGGGGGGNTGGSAGGGGGGGSGLSTGVNETLQTGVREGNGIAILSWEITQLPVTSDLKMWLDASQISGVSDGSTLSTWEDASVNNKDATLVSGTATYEANVVNGRPAINFPSGAQYNASPVLGGSSGTVFAVMKTEAHGHGDIAHTGLWRLGGAAGFSHYPFQDGRVYETAGTDTRQNFLPGTSLNVWHVYTIAAGSSHWKAYINGTEVHSNGSNTPSWQGTFSIGNDGGIFYDGDMAEMIVYGAILNDTDRNAVIAYLEEKYNI